MKQILEISKEQGRIVTIMYQKDGVITKRNIKVFEIDQDNVRAFCYLRNQPRIFKKENILSASFIHGPFLFPDTPGSHSWNRMNH